MDNLGGWVQSKPNVAKIRQENWHRTALCLINVCSLWVRVLNSYQASLNHLGAAVIRASWQLILPCGKRDVSRLPTDGTHPSPKQRLDRIKWSAKSGLVINSKSLFDNKRTKKNYKILTIQEMLASILSTEGRNMFKWTVQTLWGNHSLGWKMVKQKVISTWSNI